MKWSCIILEDHNVIEMLSREEAHKTNLRQGAPLRPDPGLSIWFKDNVCFGIGTSKSDKNRHEDREPINTKWTQNRWTDRQIENYYPGRRPILWPHKTQWALGGADPQGFKKKTNFFYCWDREIHCVISDCNWDKEPVTLGKDHKGW